MKKPKQPCAKDCKGRAAGCAVRCTNWALYVSARNEWYEEQKREKEKNEMNAGMLRVVAQNRKQEKITGRKIRPGRK